MDLKARLAKALLHTRWFTDKLLSEIPPGESWVQVPVAGSNHALWIAGHLGLATNAFIGFVDEAKKVQRDDIGALFGKGSQPTYKLADYPDPEEVVNFLSERGATFLKILEECSAEDLDREVPQGPEFMYDVGAVFQMAAWHEALHSGQLTVIHRMIGQSPIADRPN